MHRPVLLDLMDLSWQRKKEVGRRMEVILEVTHVIQYMHGDMQKGQKHEPDLTSVTQYEFQGYKE